MSVSLLCSSCRDVAMLNILSGLWCFRLFYCGINYKRRSVSRADWSSPGVVLLNCSSLPKGTHERWCLKQPSSVSDTWGQGDPWMACVRNYRELDVEDATCVDWARGLTSFLSTGTKLQLQGWGRPIQDVFLFMYLHAQQRSKCFLAVLRTVEENLIELMHSSKVR